LLLDKAGNFLSESLLGHFSCGGRAFIILISLIPSILQTSYQHRKRVKIECSFPTSTIKKTIDCYCV